MASNGWPANDRKSSNEPLQGGEPVRKVGIWLALADEDPHDLTAIQSVLEEKGYRVTTETGEEPTTDRIPIHDFDLMVTDLLPVLEKAKELNPGIMAIFVLATSSKSIPTVHAIRASADDYLLDPLGWRRWKCGSPTVLKNSRPNKGTDNLNHSISASTRRCLTW